MSACKVCGGAMKPLFVGEFCPKECDLPPEKRTVKPTTAPMTAQAVAKQPPNYCPQCGKSGTKIGDVFDSKGWAEMYMCGNSGHPTWTTTPKASSYGITFPTLSVGGVFPLN